MKKILVATMVVAVLSVSQFVQSFSDRNWSVVQAKQSSASTAKRYTIPQSGQYTIQVIGGDIWFGNNVTASIGVGFKLSENSITDFEENVFNYGEYFTWISASATTLNMIVTN